MGSSAKKRPGITGRIAFILAGVVLLMFSAVRVHADEVDDILALKSKNRDKIKRFSAEYTVETTQKTTGKTGRMRYRMKMERLSATELKGSNNPWRTETEILEPMPMKIKMEGDNVWFFKDGNWIEKKIPEKMRDQLRSMPEMSLGGDSSGAKKNFKIKVLRRNNPIFGITTRTVEYIPIGNANLFDKMEEDIEDDGFVPNTRLYQNNKITADMRSMQRENIHGLLFCTKMEASIIDIRSSTLMKTQVNRLEVEVR